MFSAESVAPTMLSDGLMHYKTVDIPMGEFWLNSPTHDKPNDMLDAISGAHIYGKPILQAEAFTTVRMDWSEHPGMLKPVQDRNYALGINKLVYHVFTHNPWMDRKPGMTLDGVGLYFQRDQPWWKAGRAWVEYAHRCQALLQVGRPVADVAVFTGEELPRRSILPDRLVSTLPGIFGEDVVRREAERLANKGEPLRELPAGVRHSANMADPEDWVDPLKGYAYDSFNPDALLRAKVNNGRVEFPGGASYGLLVLPQPHAMSTSNDYMSAEVAKKLNQLVREGASIIVNDVPQKSFGLNNSIASDNIVAKSAIELWAGEVRSIAKFGGDTVVVTRFGNGRVVKGPYKAASFEAFGLLRDVIIKDNTGDSANDVAWTHRTAPGVDIYFFSSQRNVERTLEVSLRVTGKVPELWDAVTGKLSAATSWRSENSRTILPMKLAANGSIFIILAKSTNKLIVDKSKNWTDTKIVKTLTGAWQVKFDANLGGPRNVVTFNELQDWSKNLDSAVKYYSGTARYTKSFNYNLAKPTQPIWLNMEYVANIAEVTLNGVFCGVAWTKPYRVEISKALKRGNNQLVLEVTNTWANRLKGDQRLHEGKRVTATTAPFRLEGKPLLPAGLLGAVTIQK
jgi:hypothetical protein